MTKAKILKLLETHVPDHTGEWLSLPTGVKFDFASEKNPPPRWINEVPGLDTYVVEQHCDGYYIVITTAKMPGEAPESARPSVGPMNDFWTAWRTLLSLKRPE